MMRRSKAATNVGYTDETTLPDGRRLRRGDQFTVTGSGRFRLVRVRPNGELNAWGPIRSDGSAPHAQMRSFTAATVKRVHRIKKGL